MTRGLESGDRQGYSSVVFSIIIATRDRPDLLTRALRSVAAQRNQDVDLVLVDDSMSAESRARNAALVAEWVPAAEIVAADFTAKGLGPGEARNRGIARAKRPYLAFLDDDDEWIDTEYLTRAAAILERLDLDMLFADQVAVRRDGSVVAGPVWAEDLTDKLAAAGAVAADGVFQLTPEQVLLSDGFAHLNTTILRRTLAWDRLGGFDPTIRYEEDRDLYLRAIDAAVGIGYMPLVVARHHVPQARTSASSIGVEQREACRLVVLDKAATQARSPAVRARGRRDRFYTLQKMSARAASAGQFGVAITQGRAALRDQFGVRWAVFVAGLYVRRAFSRRSQAD